MIYSFKDPSKSWELQKLHPKVVDIFYLLCEVLKFYNADVMITSMIREKNTIPGESGVHSTGRALDCVSSLSPEKCQKIAELIDKLLPERKDKKRQVMFHEVDQGNGLHFHIQVEWSSSYKDLT